MWIPCWRWNDRTCLRQWPTSSPIPQAWPPALCQGTAPSSSERSCDWERWTWCLLWPHLREKQMDGERERDGEKKKTDKRQRKRGADRQHQSQHLISQQATITVFSVVIYALQLLQIHIQTADKWLKTFTDMIWYNGIRHSVGLWDCMSQLYLFTVVSSI